LSCASFLMTASPPPPAYTLSLHDALPISRRSLCTRHLGGALPQHQPQGFLPVALHKREVIDVHRHADRRCAGLQLCGDDREYSRSEEHTSELQSRENLVCRLLLEKKKKNS